jgi:hypothetical protein
VDTNKEIPDLELIGLVAIRLQPSHFLSRIDPTWQYFLLPT